MLAGDTHRNDVLSLVRLEGHELLSRHLNCRVKNRSQEPSEEAAWRDEGGRDPGGQWSGEATWVGICLAKWTGLLRGET